MTDDVAGDSLLEAIHEARRGMKLLAQVVEASSEVPRNAPRLVEVSRAMQELAFQAWLLATQARAEASRLARLSGREADTPHLRDAT
jgi:hypothetical protein